MTVHGFPDRSRGVKRAPRLPGNLPLFEPPAEGVRPALAPVPELVDFLVNVQLDGDVLVRAGHVGSIGVLIICVCHDSRNIHESYKCYDAPVGACRAGCPVE